MSEKLNKVSSRITQPRSQGASQAMLYATGMTRADMDKAQVGIASMWWEGNPCNMHLNDLAGQIATGVREAGLMAMRFNTIGVSDGISMTSTIRTSTQKLRATPIQDRTLIYNWSHFSIFIFCCQLYTPILFHTVGYKLEPSFVFVNGSSHRHWPQC